MKTPSLFKNIFRNSPKLFIASCIVLIVQIWFFSVIFFSFPPNKNGIEMLLWNTNTNLDDREVYYVDRGFTEEESLFKFKANQEEIFSIVQNAGMRQARYYGDVIWSSLERKPYWFRPNYTPKGLYFRIFDKYRPEGFYSRTFDKYILDYNKKLSSYKKYPPSGDKRLYYEPDTQWAYFEYIEY